MQFYSVKELRFCTGLPLIKEICQFLETTDCAELKTGEIVLKDKDLFVRIGEYATESQAAKRFETHRRYADVQVIVSGVEMMGFTTETSLVPITEYDAQSDIQFFERPKCISQLVVSPGECVVFFPNEAHQPGCVYQSPAKVKKLISR